MEKGYVFFPCYSDRRLIDRAFCPLIPSCFGWVRWQTIARTPHYYPFLLATTVQWSDNTAEINQAWKIRAECVPENSRRQVADLNNQAQSPKWPPDRLTVVTTKADIARQQALCIGCQNTEPKNRKIWSHLRCRKCSSSWQRIRNRRASSEIMEWTATFALPNEFLIWVAAKVLPNCNLDFVLTEYYKERLESRLKNRETRMKAHISTEHTESTDLTESAYLQIPTDWIADTKLSPTRPFHLPLTPLLSPLSLPPPLPTSVLPYRFMIIVFLPSPSFKSRILAVSSLHCSLFLLS